MTIPAWPVVPASIDLVRWWATAAGDRTALVSVDTGARWSYAALDREADGWAALLAGLGVGVGDRVALLAHNRLEQVALLVAVLRLGAVLVPLNWRLAAVELGRVLADCSPVVLAGEDRHRGLAEAALGAAAVGDVRWLDLDAERHRGGFGDRPPPPPAHGLSLEAPYMLLYTSGSTGQAKGVVLPRRQLLWNAIATATAWQLGPQDVATASTPFFHTGGWHVFTTPLLLRGGTIVLVETFDPDRLLQVFEREGVTVAFGVPTQLAMLRERPDWGRPLPRLRWLVSGGAPCPDRVRRDVQEAGYRLREGYGLTECGPNCFATAPSLPGEPSGQVGPLVPFLDGALRDGDAVLHDPEAVGELVLRGPQLFAGYHGQPALTADALTPDGWLRTGDLASRGGDGSWRIRGRRKEMFISGGENVFPGEVEAALLECTGVAEVAVLGVPDARWGEVGCAVIVPRSVGATSPDALLVEARTRLAGYKVPRQVRFVEALPRLGSGKVDRRALAALVATPAPGGGG